MKALIAGLAAIALLGLYGYSVSVAVQLVWECAATSGCVTVAAGKFSEGMAHTMSSVGGLVSALVIAELTLTQPRKVPMWKAISSEAAGRAVGIVTFVYLLVWFTLGLSAYVIGFMQHPKMLEPLTALGQTWLGIAITAVYAYFGIKP